MNKTLIRAIHNYVNLDSVTTELISHANWDLYNGPSGSADGYPGFEEACKLISDALPNDDLWVNEDFVTSVEPDWCDENGDGEDQEDPDQWSTISADEVKRILVGNELARYV